MFKFSVYFTLSSGAKCDKYKIYMYGDTEEDIRKAFIKKGCGRILRITKIAYND